ncbi:MAG: hypothetical protein MHM6MM_005460 [Cercozoa sp. M6MM]
MSPEHVLKMQEDEKLYVENVGAVDQLNFQFDKILNAEVSNADVFEQVKGAVEDFTNGICGCIFAYGQTGAGKSHTIFGPNGDYHERGIVPRAIERIFALFDEKSDRVNTLRISMLEIYKNTLIDLLSDPEQRSVPLQIVEHVDESNNTSIRVTNLTRVTVSDERSALETVFRGSLQSHCILTMWLDAHPSVGDDAAVSMVTVLSKIHICDLAGSERLEKSNSQGAMVAELKCINQSLSQLELVVLALNDKKRTHVPWRSSVLTSLLRDSIGGNSQTFLIANVLDNAGFLHETVSTMRFASRVRNLPVSTSINTHLDLNVKCDVLQKQLQRLRDCSELSPNAESETIAAMTEFIQELSAQMNGNTTRALQLVCGFAWNELQTGQKHVGATSASVSASKESKETEEVPDERETPENASVEKEQEELSDWQRFLQEHAAMAQANEKREESISNLKEKTQENVTVVKQLNALSKSIREARNQIARKKQERESSRSFEERRDASITGEPLPEIIDEEELQLRRGLTQTKSQYQELMKQHKLLAAEVQFLERTIDAARVEIGQKFREFKKRLDAERQAMLPRDPAREYLRAIQSAKRQVQTHEKLRQVLEQPAFH